MDSEIKLLQLASVLLTG